MADPLLLKSLRDLRLQTLGWGVGVGALLLLTLALYPSISSTYGEMIRQLPEGWLAFLGTHAGLDTPEGYLNAEFFTYVPLVLAVFAITAGTGALAGEESQGTLDVLLAQPVPRLRLAAVKLAALAVAVAAIIVIVAALFWLGALLIGVQISVGRVFAALALLGLFEVAVAHVSLLLSLILPGRLLSAMAMAALLVASYILESLSYLTAVLEDLRPLFITSYFQGGRALVADISWGYVAGLYGVLLVAITVSLILFQRRDIGTSRPLNVARLLAGTGKMHGQT